MTLPMVTCPLCCRPGFTSSEALCASLVSVTTRKLCCPVCNDVLFGLDKLTIHLFSHSLNKSDTPQPKEPVAVAPPAFVPSNATNINIEPVSKRPVKIPEVSGPKPNWNDLLDQTKSIPNVPNPLLYIHPETGQLFALTESIKPPSNVPVVDSVTFNPPVVDKSVSNKAEEKDNRPFKIEIPDTPTVPSNGPSVVGPSKTLMPPPNSKPSSVEFESCKDLITKGDFSTSTDDLEELSGDPSSGSTTTRSPPAEVKQTKSTDKEIEGDELVEDLCCHICKFDFPNRTLLAMHNSIVHKKIEIEPDNKRKLFTCSLCPRTFKMRGSLMLHRRVAHSAGPVPAQTLKPPSPPKPACQICGKFFKKDIHLTQHMKAHDEKQWQCTICSKTFTTKYFLKKHRRLHTGEMPFRCPTCNKCFTFKQSYQKHLLYHNDEKPYCCSHCGRLFKELSTLQNHERIHSGEKPFTCETCGKAFRQRVSYLVHKRIHTGVMPYKCTACHKSFRYKVSGRTHKCTAQPPGVVVHNPENFVERLQAAMLKAAEKLRQEDKTDDSKTPGDKAALKVPLVKVVSEGGSQKSEDKPPKPQYYLLVKGPNNESFYQPVLATQTPQIDKASPGVSPSTSLFSRPKNIPKSEPVKPITQGTKKDTAVVNPTFRIVLKASNEPVRESQENKMVVCTLLDSTKESFQETQNEIQGPSTAELERSTTEPVIQDLYDLLDDLPGPLGDYTLDKEPVTQPLLDLSDMLNSPESGSPAEKLGRLCLSPEPGPWTFQPDKSTFPESLTTDTMSTDPLLDSINDDALKELLCTYSNNA